MKNSVPSIGPRCAKAAVLACFAVVISAIPALSQATFTNQITPNPNLHGNTLNAVAALSATDGWAVGYKNDNNLNDSRTLALHFDGTSWKAVSSPSPGTTTACKNGNTGNVLNGVAPVASNDVWAVGFSFTCTTLLAPMIQHWNGTAWRVVPGPKVGTNDNAALNAVLAFSSNNVYAVGYQPASNGAVLTLIEHWDGTSWTVMPSPNGSKTGNVLTSISGTSPTDIWAVGDRLSPGVPVKTLIEHFDGTSWSVVPSPSPLLTNSLDQNVLMSVHAVSSTDVTAVGFVLDFPHQVELTLIEHWNGTRWSIKASPNQATVAGSTNRLTGVTGVAANDLFAVGFFNDAASFGQQQTLVEHFDGKSWSVIPSPTQGVAQQLNGAAVPPGTTTVWGVGAFSSVGTDPESGFLFVPKTLVIATPKG